jgi:hypothetical protein
MAEKWTIQFQVLAILKPAAALRMNRIKERNDGILSY